MSDKSTRERIVEAADQLFYQLGFEHTSFTDIADAVQISRGNFYHHFKTKDDILDAVIAFRHRRTQAMLAQWELDGTTPMARIQCFIRILIVNRAKIMQHGCPVGTLCLELSKLEHAAQGQANAIFTLFRDWLRMQFMQLGREDDADILAMHILALSQGVATLANAFHDEAFIEREVTQLCAWLDAYMATTNNTAH